MNLLEDIKLFLPKYLSEEGESALYKELKSFPHNLDERLYSRYNQEEQVVYQGDGLADMPVVFLPNNTIEQANVLVLSNTCDNDPSNERGFDSRLLYCPILTLQNYGEVVEATYTTEQQRNSHIQDVKNQRLTNFFFLPANDSIPDSVAIFNYINNCEIEFLYTEDQPDLQSRRLFSLSQYGFYLLLIKISIHMSRVREAVERDYWK